MTQFHEEQRFRQPWLLAGMAIMTVLSISATQVDMGLGLGSLLVGAMPLALCGWLLSMTLVTDVRDDGLRIKFRLLWPERIIPFDQIKGAEAKQYRPIRDFGGWGVRGVMPVRAFNVSGNRGVVITLRDNRELMIGSQRADQLAAVINERIV